MVSPVATIVIPNFNGERYLPRLMESLASQTERSFVIVLVDDASTDGSVDYVERDWPDVRVRRIEENRGFAAACNAGLGWSKTPFVVLLNNDTHLDPRWLEEGLRPFSDPAVGAVGSLVLLADPPHRIDTAGDVYSVAGGAVKRANLRSRDEAASLTPRVFSASGAAAFYRSDALDLVGFLDARFESYYEDVDLGFRLAWAGYSCVLAPDSVCYHHLSSSYNPKGWRYHFNSARNAEIVWWSMLPAALRRKYLASHLCFLALQACNKLRQGCLRPYLAGKWAALRRREHIREKRRDLERFARLTDAQVEERLVRHWWSLHVGSRRKGRFWLEPC